MKKVCYGCKLKKLVTEFYAHSNSHDGKRTRCKECEKLVKQAWYYNRGGKAIIRQNVKAYRARTGYPGWSDPIKKKARNLSQAAIRRGRIKRKPCEVCGNMKAEAHYEDYSKPLDVRFLCNSCHRKEHPAIRAMKEG